MIEIEEIPPTEKVRFHQRLKKLTQEELAKIVMIIQEHNLEAFRELEKGRCQILLDVIDIATFKKAVEKVDEILEGEEKQTKKVKVWAWFR